MKMRVKEIDGLKYISVNDLLRWIEGLIDAGDGSAEDMLRLVIKELYRTKRW